MYTYIYIHIYIDIHMCMYVYIYTDIHTYIYMLIFIHISSYISTQYKSKCTLRGCCRSEVGVPEGFHIWVVVKIKFPFLSTLNNRCRILQ